MMPVLNVHSRPVRLLIAALVALLATLAVPYGNLWLKCQQPASEACVWSKAYLPLSLGLTFVILGAPVFIVTLMLLRRYVATHPR
ncbi:MAG: hypothetical protein M3282_02160 [Gemmatimonadota bacterium]|nr:hypothetical protein [Gemmatimonadota bacterium]